MGFSLEEIGALSDASAPGEGGIETPGAGSYKEQYGVIVVCLSETGTRPRFTSVLAAQDRRCAPDG